MLCVRAIAPLDGRPDAWPEEAFLRSGTFNGGLVGVGPGAGPFLDWICERTARDCLRAPQRGLLYAQTLTAGEDPPDPFGAADPDAFVAWLRAAPPGGPVSRYLRAVHHLRDDLQARFAAVPGHDAASFLRWVADKVAQPGQEELQRQLVAPAPG